MTSTSFNVGLTDNSRVSSRVLRPPGGGHTDIFSEEPDQPRIKQNPAAANANSHHPINGGEAPARNGQQTAQTPEPVAESKPEPPTASAPKPQPLAEPPKAEPPKRVRVPPGGFSSGLW